jgi:hypothetical protein
MVGKTNDTNCSYCNRSMATEEDHVIARQFFPPDESFRGGLPKVPVCGDFNRAKQRVEDTVGVYLQCGHASDASRQVLEGRVPRTLKKNLRLARSLRAGLWHGLVRRHSGLVVPGLGLRLDDQVLGHIHDWYCFVARGVYRHESGHNLSGDHSVHLLRPTTREQYDTLLNLLCRDSRHVHRSIAQGEFQYVFAMSRVDPISGWLFAFKSVEMFAVTLGPECPEALRHSTAASEWKRPSGHSASASSASEGRGSKPHLALHLSGADGFASAGR